MRTKILYLFQFSLYYALSVILPCNYSYASSIFCLFIHSIYSCYFLQTPIPFHHFISESIVIEQFSLSAFRALVIWHLLNSSLTQSKGQTEFSTCRVMRCDDGCTPDLPLSVFLLQHLRALLGGETLARIMAIVI